MIDYAQNRIENILFKIKIFWLKSDFWTSPLSLILKCAWRLVQLGETIPAIWRTSFHSNRNTLFQIFIDLICSTMKPLNVITSIQTKVITLIECYTNSLLYLQDAISKWDKSFILCKFFFFIELGPAKKVYYNRDLL